MSLRRGVFLVALALLVLLHPGWAASLQERIDLAAPDSTIQLAAGIYDGPITIAKPLKLIGQPGAEIRGNGRGKVVIVTGDNVTVRAFEITGSGTNLSEDDAAVYVTGKHATIEGNTINNSLHGIYLKKVIGAHVLRNVIKGKSSHLDPAQPLTETIVADSAENCMIELNVNERGNGIHLWSSEGNVIEGNKITDTRDGMYFSFTSNTLVKDNVIERVRYGLHYMYSDNNTFEGNMFTDNAAGSAMMFSKNLVVRGNRFVANRGSRAYGMLLNSVDNTRVENNDLSTNTVGIYLENCNANILTGNAIKNNYIGIRLTGSSDSNVFSRNTFAGNMHPAELSGQSTTNRWSAGGIGNRWDESETLDLNRDGIGDLPHREPDLLGELRHPFPLVGLLSGSPALSLLRFAHARVTIPGMQAIEDKSPLTSAFFNDRR